MWAIIFILGAAVAVFVMWLISKKIYLKWYEWLIGATGFMLIVAAVQHAVSASAADYATSAWMGLLIFGIPALILLAVAWRLAVRRNNVA